MMDNKRIIEALERLAPPAPNEYPLIQISQKTVAAATATKPDSPDALSVGGSAGYEVVSIWNEKKRLSKRIYLINDGPGTLFAIASADGIAFTGEGDLLPHEWREFTTCYELRVRSPDGTTKYRVSEFKPGFLA